MRSARVFRGIAPNRGTKSGCTSVTRAPRSKLFTSVTKSTKPLWTKPPRAAPKSSSLITRCYFVRWKGWTSPIRPRVLAARLIRENRALICVHSALDGAAPPHALGDALAAQLELSDARVAAPSGAESLVKIVVFRARRQLGRSARGDVESRRRRDRRVLRSGRVLRGWHGHLSPAAGRASVLGGRVSELSQIGEIKLEIVAPRRVGAPSLRRRARRIPTRNRAYRQPLAQRRRDARLRAATRGARRGASTGLVIETVNRKLHPPSIRVVRPPDFGAVETVACSPGSGASFIGKLARGTTFVCGDIKHHDALLARARGIALVDVTHAATETAAVPLMARALESVADLRLSRETNSFNPFEKWPIR